MLIPFNPWRWGQSLCWIGVGASNAIPTTVLCLILALGLVICEGVFARTKVAG